MRLKLKVSQPEPAFKLLQQSTDEQRRALCQVRRSILKKLFDRLGKQMISLP